MAINPEQTLADLGEFGSIARFVSGLNQGPHVSVGPGDDGAVFRCDGDAVVSVDSLIEGVHFRRDWSTAGEIGRKCVAVNVADIEAMGVRPTSILVAFSAPKDLRVAWLQEWWEGLCAEAQRAGVCVIGGDTTSSRDISISITAVGDTDGEGVCTRAGAEIGDTIAYSGRLGWSAAGLAILSRGFRSPRSLVQAHKVPEVPYGQGVRARAAGATSLIDVSDGLVADLGHVAQASHVSLAINTSDLVIPEPMHAVAAATGGDPLTFVLTGGEDHALVATFPGALPTGWEPIGTVVKAEEAHVLVDGKPWLLAAGWDHFAK